MREGGGGMTPISLPNKNSAHNQIYTRATKEQYGIGTMGCDIDFSKMKKKNIDTKLTSLFFSKTLYRYGDD